MNISNLVRRQCAAVIFGSTLMAPGVHAGLIGDEINAVWTFAPFYTDNNTFVAGDGVDLVASWGLSGDLDVKDLSIEVLFDFNGGVGKGVNWLFQDLDIEILDARVATNYIGWDDSFFQFGSGFASVNFLQDTDFRFNDNYFEIFFDVENVTNVPLPGSLALLVLGLGSLASRAGRKKTN